MAGRWSGASAFSTVGAPSKKRVMKEYKLNAAAADFCLYTARTWCRTAETMMHGAGTLPGQAARQRSRNPRQRIFAISDEHYLQARRLLEPRLEHVLRVTRSTWAPDFSRVRHVRIQDEHVHAATPF